MARRASPLFLVLAAAVWPALGGTDRPRESPTTFDECEALVRARPRDLDAYRCYRVVASFRRDWDEAVRRLEAYLAVRPFDARARLALAGIEAIRGADRAETLYREAASGFGSELDPKGEVYARCGLVGFLQRRGRLADARVEAERVTSLVAASHDPDLVGRARNAEAWLAYAEGDYTGALTAFRQAETLAFPEGKADLRSAVVSGLGAVSWATGRFHDAMTHYRREAEILEEVGDRFEAARVRSNILLITGRLLARGETTWREILALQHDALEAAISAGNRGVEGSCRLSLAQNPLLDRRTRIGHAEAGLAIAREYRKFEDTCFALRLLAGLAGDEEWDRPDRAFRAVDEAIELARDHASASHLARGMIVRAGMHWPRGHREEAVRDMLSALEEIEKIRDRQRDEGVRARVFSEWAFAYHRLCGYLLDPPGSVPSPADLDLAFSVAERLRARALLDALDSAGVTRALLHEGGPLQARRDAALVAMSAVQKRLLDPSLGPTARKAALEELDGLEIEEAAARDAILRAEPAFAAVRAPSIPSLGEVRSALDSDQALLAYQLSTRRVDERMPFYNGGSWLFVVTRDDTKVFPLPEADIVAEAVGVYLGLLDSGDEVEPRASAGVYRKVLAPALDALPTAVRRLVVVPDGALHGLPFHALRSEPGAEPLAARWEISLAPSVAAWVRWKNAPPRAAHAPALVLADPELPGETSTFREAAPWRESLRLGPLPWARTEARAVGRGLGTGCVLRVGAEASEAYLKAADLDDYSILHLAAHAVVDEGKPERSAVLLAAGSEREDGLLQVREIARLELRDRVVVLSACSSASGETIAGEGPLGLARAFFAAGARTVVASLWPLRDDEAAALAEDLARHLGRGSSVGAALAAARRDRIAAGATPAAWAGLVVIGDGNLVPLPRGRARWTTPPVALTALATLLAAALSTMAVLLVRRARRRRKPDEAEIRGGSFP